LSTPTPRFTVVAAVNNRKTLEANLLASPALAGDDRVQLLIKEGFRSASLAYNDALDEARSDVVVFVHQDIYLPAGWFDQVAQAIESLESAGRPWGVLGSFGSRGDAFGGLGRVFTNGLGLHGNPIDRPEPAETLDEIVLILRKSSGLRFDPKLSHFHMYGVDICMAARDAGLATFAIPAFCVHNTNQLLELPPEFYECYHYVKRKWKRYLPIAASCMSLSRFDSEMRRKRFDEFVDRLLRRRRQPLRRVDDPRTLLVEKS